MFSIKRTWPKTLGLRLRMFMLGLVDIASGLVSVLSLGFLNTDWRANLVFSEWFGD